MQKNDDQFSGDELDESSKSIDEENESIPEEENSKGTWAKHRGKKRVSLCIALGLCFLIGIGYFYLKGKAFDILQEEETTQLHRLKIPKDQLLLFHSFVIPLKEKKGFTYISLSISFNVPNKELGREIIAKKEQLRGIMYDILREEINKTEEIPPLEKIKGFLTRRVNMALSGGKVNEIYITKFLAV
ncbi:MAG: flagellar basal body-associated FliL family protein [Deltaproteobacteria bacterium]|nr:flagellar basal body-associated FliL family protein [Deltaproteobacteria bacterium]MBW2334732.1 flagellar basal body-associated FliL family protein [Deltaproteobacteria bacterium]